MQGLEGQGRHEGTFAAARMQHHYTDLTLRDRDASVCACLGDAEIGLMSSVSYVATKDRFPGGLVALVVSIHGEGWGRRLSAHETPTRYTRHALEMWGELYGASEIVTDDNDLAQCAKTVQRGVLVP